MQRAVWLSFSALGLMALLSLYALPATAAGEIIVDDGGAVTDVKAGDGMPASNPRVRPILAAHPGQLVVVCVAGCPGKARAVQILPRPVTARVGGYVPSAAKMGNETYGPPRPGKLPAATAGSNDDVVCMAGCVGRPGQVVQRLSGLPAPKRVRAPEKPASDAKRNEPLDIGP